MEYQQPPFVRPPQPPPPPSMVDPNHHQPSFAPPPPAPTWFSGQFQYNGHSPSPAPPNHNQQHWGPPPPAPPSHGPYPAPSPYPAPPPYPTHHQYPPPPPPRPAIHQSYRPQLNQEWQNPSWSQHQGWDNPAHNNGEDWAAKARAWAAAQTSTDDQYPQSQHTTVARAEENHYTMNNPHYSDGQHFPVAASSYQQYQPSIVPPYRAPESSLSSGYVPDAHFPFPGINGSSVGESNAAFPHQESTPSSLSVHQQEVPSSYSSVAGKEDAADQNEQLYKSPWAFASTSQQQVQPLPAAVGGTAPMEHYSFSHQSAEPPTDLSDQPLNFAPRFSQDHDQHVQPNYSSDSGVPFRGMDNPASVPSVQAWSAPAANGVVYPPVHPSGPQVDPSLAIPSPFQGHSGPLFGRISGQNFQPMIPSVSAPFGGGGTFPGDVFSASGVPDRPKKASVPNWLREEIIKKKAVIATSAPELAEDANSFEVEAINKSSGKGDIADSKSMDSSRSTEDEADEEDEVETARTAAINQEIKRVLTEVLLKVTDELFDEIATKVLNEDNPALAVDNNTSSNREVSPSAPTVPTSKASAKVLIATKIGETDSDDTRQSTLSAPGALLGLASYASDDEDDDDNQNIGMPNSSRNTTNQPSAAKMLPEDVSLVKNGRSVAETKENQRNNLVLEIHPARTGPSGGSDNHMRDNELNDKGSGIESTHGSLRSKNSSKTEFLSDDINKGAVVVNDADVSLSKNNVEERVVIKIESSVENIGAKKVRSDVTELGETRNKHDNIDRYDKRRSSSGKDSVKEAGEDESHRRQEEKKVKKEKSDDRNDSKEKLKEQSLKSAEKSKDTDSKKRSSHRDDKDLKEIEKDRRTRGSEGNDRKRDRTRVEKGERSRNKLTSDSSRHKRHRSSSVGSKGQDTKNQSVISYTNDSSDAESSEDSRRKSRSRKRKLSRSPVKSRRRQVPRSPHSKHSQRRHSPYSSLEITRRKRSRSRSPDCRKR